MGNSNQPSTTPSISSSTSSSQERSLANLFDTKVGYQWGLRGDPHFWDILKDHFSQYKQQIPSEQFLAEISKVSMEKCEGQDILKADNMLRVNGIPTGGMSGGFISHTFWQEEAVPELLNRLKNF